MPSIVAPIPATVANAAQTTSPALMLSADGVDLQSLAFNITTRGSRWVTPAVVGANLSVPGRNGTIWNNAKRFDENTFVLNMWVVGANPDGSMPSDGNMRRQVLANAETLLRVFGKRYSLIYFVQTMEDGSQRECYGEVLKAVSFATMAGGTRAEFSIEVVVPGAFWQDTTDSTYDSGVGLMSGARLTMPIFDGSTAPVDDAMYVVSGPCTNPKLTVIPTGEWIQLNAAVASGTDWQIDSSQWSSATGVSLGFGNGGTSVVGQTQRSSAGRLVAIPAYPSTNGPLIQFDCTSPGSGTRLQIRGRRKYLLG